MEHTARRMWRLFETYHDVTYFTAQSRAALDALGCKGFWMGYFGARSAPLGAAPPELVTSVFYNFHPSRVARALPDAWAIAAPDRYLAARLSGADDALRALLDESLLDDLAGVSELARVAAAAAPTAGRPLGAANAVLPWPEPPHLALWHACTILRESRGDGHVAALVAAGVDPCEALVLFVADRGMDAERMRQWRGWSEAEWSAASGRLAERGLIAGEVLTAAGRELREWIEERTDAAASAPWEAADPERFDALLRPVVERLSASHPAFGDNPMAMRLVRA